MAKESRAPKVVSALRDALLDLLPAPARASARLVSEGLLEGVRRWARDEALLKAACRAEKVFLSRAREELGSDDLTDAVVSLPLHNTPLFRRALASLLEDLDETRIEEALAETLRRDWGDRFTKEEVQRGVTLYLDCLRVQLLQVEGFREIVTGLATLRTQADVREIKATVTRIEALLPGTPPRVPPPLFDIPRPPKDFVGRQVDEEHLLAEFDRGVLITGLTGGAGIGKTALARRLAYALADRFPDGGLEIDLKGVARPPESPLTSEEAMRRLLAPFYPDEKLPDAPEELASLYRATFRARRVLLLLDNARDAAQVRPLLPDPPSAAIVTSRLRFSLGEWRLILHRLDLLPPAEARDLLRRVAPRLADAPDGDLDRLAERCGRLPLALRVAAARLQSRPDWSLEDLLERLEDERRRLAVLKEPGDPDLDVEAAIALSYVALSPAAQARFRALAVFPAPFDRAAAAAVWGAEDEAADEALGELLGLNLLEYDAERGAYELHDLVRLFARARLEEHPDEAEEATLRHAWYFLEEAGRAEDDFKRGGILPALTRFAAFWPHLEAAWERMRGAGEEGLRWLDDFAGRFPYLLDLHLPPRERIPYLEVALDAARRLGDRRGEGNHLGNLGNAYAALGEVRKAIEYYEQALKIDREIGNRRGEGADLGNLGNACFRLGEVRKAIEYYKQALEIARQIGDRRGESVHAWNLASAYEQIGRYQEACALMRITVEYERAIGHPDAEEDARQMEEVCRKAEGHQGAL